MVEAARRSRSSPFNLGGRRDIVFGCVGGADCNQAERSCRVPLLASRGSALWIAAAPRVGLRGLRQRRPRQRQAAFAVGIGLCAEEKPILSSRPAVRGAVAHASHRWPSRRGGRVLSWTGLQLLRSRPSLSSHASRCPTNHCNDSRSSIKGGSSTWAPLSGWIVRAA